MLQEARQNEADSGESENAQMVLRERRQPGILYIQRDGPKEIS